MGVLLVTGIKTGYNNDGTVPDRCICIFASMDGARFFAFEEIAGE